MLVVLVIQQRNTKKKKMALFDWFNTKWRLKIIEAFDGAFIALNKAILSNVSGC